MKIAWSVLSLAAIGWVTQVLIGGAVLAGIITATQIEHGKALQAQAQYEDLLAWKSARVQEEARLIQTRKTVQRLCAIEQRIGDPTLYIARIVQSQRAQIAQLTTPEDIDAVPRSDSSSAAATSETATGAVATSTPTPRPARLKGLIPDVGTYRVTLALAGSFPAAMRALNAIVHDTVPISTSFDLIDTSQAFTMKVPLTFHLLTKADCHA